MSMRFGIVGLGNHAINRVMPVILESGNSITAIYSRNIDKARKQVMSYPSQAYDSIDKFFEEGLFDGAYISTPNFLHYEHTRRALQTNKHVLLEKPMTLTLEHARELVELAERSNLVLAVGFHMRFHPAVQDAKNLISSGELGDISYIEGSWASLSARNYSHPDNIWWKEEEKVGGGSVMATGVHVIDTINYIMGNLPNRVTAIRDPSGATIDLSQQITMRYGGTIASVFSSRGVKYPMNNLVIYGTEGTVVFTNIFSTSVDTMMIRNGKKVKDYRGVNMYKEEIRAFSSMVSGKVNHIATGRDGLEVVRIVELGALSDKHTDSEIF